MTVQFSYVQMIFCVSVDVWWICVHLFVCVDAHECIRVCSLDDSDRCLCLSAIPYFLRSDLSLNLELSTLAGQRVPQIPLSLPFCVRITYIL